MVVLRHRHGSSHILLALLASKKTARIATQKITNHYKYFFDKRDTSPILQCF